jgi:hypothetical protein
MDLLMKCGFLCVFYKTHDIVSYAVFGCFCEYDNWEYMTMCHNMLAKKRKVHAHTLEGSSNIDIVIEGLWNNRVSFILI